MTMIVVNSNTFLGSTINKTTYSRFRHMGNSRCTGGHDVKVYLYSRHIHCRERNKKAICKGLVGKKTASRTQEKRLDPRLPGTPQANHKKKKKIWYTIYMNICHRLYLLAHSNVAVFQSLFMKALLIHWKYHLGGQTSARWWTPSDKPTALCARTVGLITRYRSTLLIFTVTSFASTHPSSLQTVLWLPARRWVLDKQCQWSDRADGTERIDGTTMRE